MGKMLKKCGVHAIFESSVPGSRGLSFFHRIRFSVLKKEGRQAVLLFYREFDSVVGIPIQQLMQHQYDFVILFRMVGFILVGVAGICQQSLALLTFG